MADGTVQAMAYDSVNRITESVDALGIRRQVAYDARDNVVAVTDGRGSTTTFTYDALDRQTSRTNALGQTWTFEYDARDLRVATVKPDGTRIAYGYDDRRRLMSMGVAEQPKTLRSYAYDTVSNLVRATVGEGTAAEIVHTFAYDERDQITTADVAGAALPSHGFVYEYDALGRRIRMADGRGGETRYLYDDADRLTGIVLPSGETATKSHDAAGRRTGQVHGAGAS